MRFFGPVQKARSAPAGRGCPIPVPAYRSLGADDSSIPHCRRAAEADDTAAKHLAMFNRRAAKGQCFHRPYLGTREFAADFALVEDAMPPSTLPADQRDIELGWMLHDIDYGDGMTPRFFRAELRSGVIDVPALDALEVKA